MKLLKSMGIATVFAFAISGCAADNTEGKDYPSDEITWIVPYAAGGNTDSISRAVAKAMSSEMDTDIIVENDPGGSGAVGMQKIKSSKPDGYTIGLFTTGTMTVTPLVNSLDYSYADFSNIGEMLTQPVLLISQPDGTYADAKELFATAKKKPGTISVGVPGATTPQAYELERLEMLYGIEFNIVPFESNGEILNALRSGNIDTAALNASADVQKQVGDGDLEALAIGEADRAASIKDVPTLKELGYDKLVNSGTTIGLTGPGDLPDDVLETLESGLETALDDEAVVKLLGEDNISDEFIGSEELTKLLSEDQKLFESLIDSK